MAFNIKTFKFRYTPSFDYLKFLIHNLRHSGCKRAEYRIPGTRRFSDVMKFSLNRCRQYRDPADEFITGQLISD